MKKLWLAMAFAFAPAMALAAESGPVAVDTLLHKLQQTNIGAWINFLVIVWMGFAFLRTQWRDEVLTGKMSRWDFIKSSIPFVHGQAQKAKGLSKTIDKAVAFIDYMDELLQSAGLLEIQKHEKTAIKALGSGYHQEFKAVRDAGVVINGDISPLELPSIGSKELNGESSTLETSPI